MSLARLKETCTSQETILHAKKAMFKKSLFLTARHLLGYKDINPRTHKDVIEMLESPIRRKLIVMPRGTFKSSICTVAYPVWTLLNQPNSRILIDSELYSNSKNFLREIRLHLEGPRVISVFGESRSDTWNEGEVTVSWRNKVLKEASLTASGIGAEKTGQHYDVIIMDDMNSPNNSQSKEGREKVIDHFRYAQSILEPDGILLVVATRYSEDDIPGFILNNLINREGLMEP